MYPLMLHRFQYFVETNVPRAEPPSQWSVCCHSWGSQKGGEVHFQDPSSWDRSFSPHPKTLIPSLLSTLSWALLAHGPWSPLQHTHHSPPCLLCSSHWDFFRNLEDAKHTPLTELFHLLFLASEMPFQTLLTLTLLDFSHLSSLSSKAVPSKRQPLATLSEVVRPLVTMFFLFNFFIRSIYHYWKLARLSCSKNRREYGQDNTFMFIQGLSCVGCFVCIAYVLSHLTHTTTT